VLQVTAIVKCPLSLSLTLPYLKRKSIKRTKEDSLIQKTSEERKSASLKEPEKLAEKIKK
jgi:hypothetical protein